MTESPRSFNSQYTYQELNVPEPRIPDISPTPETAITTDVRPENDESTREGELLDKIETELLRLRQLLEKFDIDHDVSSYNQKTLVGDNPMVYVHRRPLAERIAKLEVLRARVIQLFEET